MARASTSTRLFIQNISSAPSFISPPRPSLLQPVPSFAMFRSLAALVLALAATSSAFVPNHSAHHRRHNKVGSVSYVPRSTAYKLADRFEGQSFFE